MGAEEFAAATDVSRETLAHLKTFAALLADWNSRHNLVSARSLEDLWQRHIWDSAQLAPLVPPDAKSLADLGAGAGFPGLVLAEMLRDKAAVTLFEATTKKCDFLKAAAQRMELSVSVQNVRMEDVSPQALRCHYCQGLRAIAQALALCTIFHGPEQRLLVPQGSKCRG